MEPAEVILRSNISITFSYNLQSELDRFLKGFNINFEQRNFDTEVNYKLRIKSGELAIFKETLHKLSFSNQIKLNEY